MQPDVDLKQMTLPEKLALMEALWNELSSREEEIPVPEWHKQILDDRLRAVEQGKATYSTWETARARIEKRTS